MQDEEGAKNPDYTDYTETHFKITKHPKSANEVEHGVIKKI